MRGAIARLSTRIITSNSLRVQEGAPTFAVRHPLALRRRHMLMQRTAMTCRETPSARAASAASWRRRLPLRHGLLSCNMM